MYLYISRVPSKSGPIEFRQNVDLGIQNDARLVCNCLLFLSVFSIFRTWWVLLENLLLISCFLKEPRRSAVKKTIKAYPKICCKYLSEIYCRCLLESCCGSPGKSMKILRSLSGITLQKTAGDWYDFLEWTTMFSSWSKWLVDYRNWPSKTP